MSVIKKERLEWLVAESDRWSVQGQKVVPSHLEQWHEPPESIYDQPASQDLVPGTGVFTVHSIVLDATPDQFDRNAVRKDHFVIMVTDRHEANCPAEPAFDTQADRLRELGEVPQ
ncbi:MAG: hypothetical protein A3B10_00980 [Candidatus Doudnabacteria bacterium RIFCSPLOWO2_01_FULL_44_21]|uniref:Uncharacterized protein n=1 Tax=Candidatus Doudnabacteria bacterium RIFCSPLOWO2_01_FULL_44_21 TaxID=1817841 RepID=A0A1F5PWR9_9BACT|nr:MAG: hypothetical protein A3B95_03890 [Candidatus Doudnabacteria bacterium RIFCSPHIGHO2_02_FULL_43_13b]OGE94365.1 MAG: hypothetical protein A3B10_00980 [Candidatus Doudnabacteria bacterium RIFCSPLOWO2_01_FULL_44_21]